MVGLYLFALSHMILLQCMIHVPIYVYSVLSLATLKDVFNNKDSKHIQTNMYLLFQDKKT